MRRGQMEMVGLVFIVVLLIIGAVLWIRLSAIDTGGGQRAQDLQGATSFLVALKETTLPMCGTSFERVAASCAAGGTLCGDPCYEAQTAMREIAQTALGDRGVRYNLSIEQTGLTVINGCDSANLSVDIAAAPRAPLVLPSGAQRNIVLSIC